MRKPLLLTVLFAALLWTSSIGQSTANYNRTSNATASLATMTGSTPLLGSGVNNSASEVFEIGFDFWYMGTRYYSFSANSNGAIRLGNSAISGSFLGSSFPNTQAIIAPFLQDLKTSATGKVHFINSGTAPNRSLTVEFLDMDLNSGSTTADATFQVTLYETSGVIQFTYGAMTVASASGTATNQKAVIGFCNNTTANQMMTVTHATPFTTNTTATATVVTYSATGTIAGLNSASNGSRKQITFTPTVPLPPLAPNATGTTTTATNINWTDIAGELGYVIFMSDDGGLTYDFILQKTANTNTANVTPMLAGKTYIFKVYSMSEGCLTPAASTVSITTGTCGSTLTNTATYTGSSSINWSALTWSAGHSPTSCEDAVLILNRTATGTESITVNLDVDIAVRSLTLRNISPNTALGDRKYFNLNGYVRAEIAGDLILESPGGNRANRCTWATQEKTVINGNVVMGSAVPGVTEGFTSIGSSGNNPGQMYTLRGNMTYNKRGYTTDEHAVFTFDKNGTQYIYNNIPAGSTNDTLQAVLFEKLIIGNAHSPTVIFGGTGGQDGYIETASRGGVIINSGSTLVMPNTYSLNCLGGVSYWKMGANTKLQLGGDQSVIDPYTLTAWGVAGSNFPASFNAYILDPTSTIEYNGPNSITQTIYHGVTYQKLVVTNGSGSGRAPKNTTGALNISVSANINALADVTLGNTVACTGPLNVIATGGLYCGTNVVSGAGAFTLATTGYLGMGHLSGITSGTTANGNIQMMGGRSFNPGANYIYNGSGTQVTGNGLPSTCNDLTIDNPVTVTIATDQLVNGVNALKQGTFDIGTTKLTINGAGTLTSTGGKMKANAGILNMAGTTGTAQSLAGSWFLNRNISTLVNSNTKGITVAATAGDTLLISSGLLYGAVTNSAITTNDNITLLSRDTATARFGEIVTASGNTIAGKVNVERYISTLRKWRHLAWPTTSTQTAKQTWMENNSPNGNTVPGYGCIVTDEKATWSGFGFDSQSLSGPSVKSWNPTTGLYVGIPNTTSYQMNTESAYFNFVRGDRSCTPANSTTSSTILRTTGTLKTGNQVFTIPANKYGAVGNPYASAIDLRRIDTLNLTNTFYVWDPKLTGSYGLGAYQTIYASGANYVVLPGGGSYGSLNTPVDTVESGQAMFVKARSSAGTLTFKEVAKNIGKRTMSRTSVGEEAVYPLLSLRDPGGNTLVDGCMAAFDYTYPSSVDDGDVTKMVNTSENVSLKRDGQLLAIERRGAIMQNDTLFLNVTGLRIHAYQWDITMDEMLAPNRSAWLVDNYLGTQTQLNLVTPNAVQFDVVSAPASYAANRFMIVFRQAVATLPVRFTNISAIRNANKTVTVLWNTQTEMFMNAYKVERSLDGANFTEIATVTPTANNGGGASYTYLDKYASEGVNYYRVNGISYNGQSQRTATVKVGPLSKETTISIYPNPVTDGIVNLRFENQPKGDYSVSITNKLGQLIRTENVSVQNSNTVQMIHLGNIASGSYQATVTDESGTGSTISFVVR